MNDPRIAKAPDGTPVSDASLQTGIPAPLKKKLGATGYVRLQTFGNDGPRPPAEFPSGSGTHVPPRHP